MKRLFYMTMLFFSLVLTILLAPKGIQAQSIETIGLIQNTETETVVLISNNLLNSEISSNKDEKNTNYSGNSHFLISFNLKENIFNKDKTKINNYTVHNLLDNKQKTHQIRAP